MIRDNSEVDLFSGMGARVVLRVSRLPGAADRTRTGDIQLGKLRGYYSNSL
jgi:hypothetical protein